MRFVFAHRDCFTSVGLVQRLKRKMLGDITARECEDEVDEEHVVCVGQWKLTRGVRRGQ